MARGRGKAPPPSDLKRMMFRNAGMRWLTQTGRGESGAEG